MKKKILHVITSLLLAVSLIMPPIQAEAAVKLSKKSIVIIKGQSCQLKVKGTKKKVKWSVKNKRVASVTSKGKIKGKKKGITYVYARVQKKKLSCKVRVETPSLNMKSVEIAVGDSEELQLNGTIQKVRWGSSNKAVASVDNAGNVTANAEGNATVYAVVSKKKYSCRVSVFSEEDDEDEDSGDGDDEGDAEDEDPADAGDEDNSDSDDVVNDDNNNTANDDNNNTTNNNNNTTTNNNSNTTGNNNNTTGNNNPTNNGQDEEQAIAVSQISLDKTEIILESGKSEMLTATVSPADASNKKFAYSSSDSNVAKIDQNGTVTAGNAGTATVTAKTEDGGKTASCTVKVYQKNVCLGGGYKTYQLKGTNYCLDVAGGLVYNGARVQLWTGIYDNNAQKWRSDDHVAQHGGYVMTPACGHWEGKVLHVVKNGGQAAAGQKIHLGQYGDDYPGQCWQYIKMYDGYYKIMLAGTDLVVEANAPEQESEFKLEKFSLNNDRQDWDIKDAPFTFINITGVSLNKTNEFLEAGKSLNLSATVSPSNASDRRVTYSSSNEGVARVDNSGKVTAVAAGTANITVRTTNQGKTASCTIKVYQKNVAMSGGYKTLKLRGTNRNLDVYDNKPKNEAKVQVWDANDTNAQKWRVDDHRGKYGGYALAAAGNTNFVLDVYRGKAQPAARQKIDLWTFNDQQVQIWQFVKMHDGYYKLMLRGTDLVIQADSQGQGSGLKLAKFDLNNGRQDFWISGTNPQANPQPTSNVDKMKNVISKVGKQTDKRYGDSYVMCSAYCISYVRGYLFNDFTQPTTYWSADGAVWGRGGGTWRNGNVLSIAKQYLDAGKPSILHVRTSSGTHYVVAVAYSGSGNSLSDFTVADPWDGSIKKLNAFSLFGDGQIITF